jgi:hypothetical protein
LKNANKISYIGKTGDIMRTFILVGMCVLVVGIVMITVFQAPVDNRAKISVDRIAVSSQPLPVFEGHHDTEKILDSFPDPKKLIQEATIQPDSQSDSEQNQVALHTPYESRKPKTTMEGDRIRLLALIEDWVYIEFSQIGNSRKTGTIHKSRTNEILTVSEGETLDNGVIVQQLASDQVILRLGESSFALRIAVVPDFFEEVKNKIRPLTPDEQEAAYEYYMRRYGDKFKEYSRNYRPPYGVRQPTKVTPEDLQKGMEEYEKRYGRQFAKENGMPFNQMSNSQDYLKRYQEYVKKYHAGREMPDFSTLNQQLAPDTPGSRVQSNSN